MGNQTILIIIGVIVGNLSNVLVQRMRRKKTESEADINAATAEKIKADAMTVMYTTISEMSKDFQALTRGRLDLVREMGTFKRDIWRLEGEAQKRARQDVDRLAQIKKLEDTVASLMTAKTDLAAQVVELMAAKVALEKQVADLTEASNDKDSQIEAMRGRINVLETERADLNKRLEAKEESGDNGKVVAKDTAIVAESEPETPETITEKTGDGS